MLKRLAREKGGNFALTAALASAFIILGIGMSIDYSRAVTDRDHLQQALDAGLLAAMNKTTLAEQREVIENVLVANLADGGLDDPNAEVAELNRPVRGRPHRTLWGPLALYVRVLRPRQNRVILSLYLLLLRLRALADLATSSRCHGPEREQGREQQPERPN